VEGARVGVGIDGDGLDTHLARRLDDTAGNLAAVADQNLLEHETPRPFFPLLPFGSGDGNHTKGEGGRPAPLFDSTM